jgi:hypothetical protein
MLQPTRLLSAVLSQVLVAKNASNLMRCMSSTEPYGMAAPTYNTLHYLPIINNNIQYTYPQSVTDQLHYVAYRRSMCTYWDRLKSMRFVGFLPTMRLPGAILTGDYKGQFKGLKLKYIVKVKFALDPLVKYALQ